VKIVGEHDEVLARVGNLMQRDLVGPTAVDRTLHAFCPDLSLCPRGHSVFQGDEWWEVFCFAEKAHTDAFRKRFGGVPFDLKDRGRRRK
jgi:hypothetical protein